MSGGLHWRFDNRLLAAQLVRKAAAEGLRDGAEHVLEESNRIIPHQVGTLEGSGHVDLDAGALRAAVSYDTPYACVQHEDTSLNHPNGRQSKFLEKTLRARAAAVVEHIGRRIGSVM